nr:C-type lectin domain family 5 member A isoform X1 [Jaculus jaculus]
MMNWHMIIPGLIVVVIKAVGMTVFLLYFSQIFERNNESFTPTESYGTACSKDWDLYQGRCFWFSISESPWNASNEDCIRKGAMLAIADTPEKLNYLQGIAGAEKYFIGLIRQPAEKNWRWINKSLFRGTVANENPNFNCVTIGLTKTFDAALCDTSYRWICEKTPK